MGSVVGTHYCLAVGNDEGLELDETGEDEELGEVDEEEAKEYEGEDVRRIQIGRASCRERVLMPV